ncbi:MAG: antitoxin Xre/MbcA/ParS toxin-binding domain-containing protein [Candidatus Binatia bacterium]
MISEVREGAAPEYRRPAGNREPLAHADPRLHSSGGNLDARRIAARLGVPLKRLAPALGYTPQGLSKNPASDNLQDRLAEIAHVLNRLRSLVADDRSVSIWLRAPHPDLGGATPLSCILSGRTAAVNALLHLAEAGQTS